METVKERFLRYVKFDTKSDENAETCPSTQGQRLFGAALVEEMLAMGIADGNSQHITTGSLNEFNDHIGVSLAFALFADDLAGLGVQREHLVLCGMRVDAHACAILHVGASSSPIVALGHVSLQTRKHFRLTHDLREGGSSSLTRRSYLLPFGPHSSRI